MKRTMRLVSKSATMDNCPEAGMHNRCFFCDLSTGSLGDFDAIALTGFYPRGTKIFAEGQHPKGVFILCSGRAKLLIGSSKGRSLMRIAEQGEMLGLSATLSGHPYEGSAEMLDAGEVNFIRRDHFLSLLNNQAEVILHVAKHLSNDYMAAHEQVRALALSHSVAEKLARLLLCWCNKNGRETEHGIHLKLSLTHGEIAQIIGVSRETVSRLLCELRNNGVIQLKGSNLFIKNKAVLEEMVGS